MLKIGFYLIIGQTRGQGQMVCQVSDAKFRLHGRLRGLVGFVFECSGRLESHLQLWGKEHTLLVGKNSHALSLFLEFERAKPLNADVAILLERIRKRTDKGFVERGHFGLREARATCQLRLKLSVIHKAYVLLSRLHHVAVEVKLVCRGDVYVVEMATLELFAGFVLTDEHLAIYLGRVILRTAYIIVALSTVDDGA